MASPTERRCRLVLLALLIGGCIASYKTQVIPMSETSLTEVGTILYQARVPHIVNVNLDYAVLRYSYKAPVFGPYGVQLKHGRVDLASIAKADAYANGVVLAWSADTKLLLQVVCSNSVDARYLAGALMTLGENARRP